MAKPPTKTTDSTKPEGAKRVAIAIEMDFAYPWHHDCCQGILEYGEQQGWRCVIDPFLVSVTDQGGDGQYDGVVGRLDAETAEIAKSHGIPAVNHWGNAPSQELPSVLIDEVAVGRLTGEHLMACGYRRFAFVGVQDNMPGDQQLDGLTQAVTAKGFKPPTTWMYSQLFEESREELTRFRRDLIAWLSALEPPVGIAAVNATAARYIAQVCSELGLDVPRDIGIVVQSSDYSSDTGTPSITAVGQDFMQLGIEAAKLLDQLMQGKEVHPLQRTLQPTPIHVRDSTDVFLCEDELVKNAMRFIAEHCRETLKVEDVANALLTSESTLRRRFEQVLGRQVKDEIARLRTNHVKLLLTETSKPLSTISEDCGFSSPTQFARYFSNAVGVTPSTYRKKSQAD